MNQLYKIIFAFGFVIISIVSIAQDCQLRTQGHGAWGASPKGKNNAQYLHTHFDGAFPGGLILGCNTGYTLTLTSASAVTVFLPAGGPPKALTRNYVDPSKNSLKNIFASQITALALSVGFDSYDPGFARDNLAHAVITSGTFAGWTVQQVLDTAQKVLGGCPSLYSINELKSIVSDINGSFENGRAVNPGLLNCGNGCPQITVSGEVTNDTCSNECNGSIAVQVSGGSSPYTYLWDSGETSGNLAGLCSGSYSLTVSDSDGCEGTATFQVDQINALSVRAIATDISCACQGDSNCCDGEVSTIVSGGTPPYSYLWSTGDTTPAITASAASTDCYNAGDGQVVTSGGQTYQADAFFAGSTFTFINNDIPDILNTADDTIYRTERYGMAFSYHFPVDDGNYAVDLHFAEIFYGATGGNLFGGVGSRVFHVIIENDTVLNGYDIVGDVGAETAVIKSFTTNVSDGSLDISFVGVVNNAKVNAICISNESAGLCPGSYTVTVTDQAGCSRIQDVVVGNEPCDFGTPKRSAHETDKSNMTVFPNPVSNVSTVTISLPEDDNVTVVLIGADGKVVRSLFEGSILADENYKVSIHTGELEAGLYYVRMMSERGYYQGIPVILTQ